MQPIATFLKKQLIPATIITIYGIARHLKISATTVSRGLKDHPAINKNTRKKIADAVRDLGYRSNSSLRSKKIHTIGVIVPRLNSYFVANVLAGMEDTANKEGYNIIISHSLENAEKEVFNAQTLFNKRVAEHILKMKEKDRPDSVFSANDTAAVRCMIRLKTAGIRIPAAIAFARFNNDPTSKVVEPNLTRVNYSGYSVGEAAVSNLINHLNSISSIKITNTILLRSDLIVREPSLKTKLCNSVFFAIFMQPIAA